MKHSGCVWFPESSSFSTGKEAPRRPIFRAMENAVTQETLSCIMLSQHACTRCQHARVMPFTVEIPL